MSKIQTRGWTVSSPKNFNPKWVNRGTIKASMARIGKIQRVEYTTNSEREAARALSSMACHPYATARQCPQMSAKGVSHKNKGGVLPRALMGW